MKSLITYNHFLTIILTDDVPSTMQGRASTSTPKKPQKASPDHIVKRRPRLWCLWLNSVPGDVWLWEDPPSVSRGCARSRQKALVPLALLASIFTSVRAAVASMALLTLFSPAAATRWVSERFSRRGNWFRRVRLFSLSVETLSSSIETCLFSLFTRWW